MTKIFLYYGFDPDDTNYQYAKVSAFDDKETTNLGLEICKEIKMLPFYNKAVFFKIAKHIKKLEKKPNTQYKYYFKMNPDFYQWTKDFKNFFKELNVQVVFKYSPYLGNRLISSWRKTNSKK